MPNLVAYHVHQAVHAVGLFCPLWDVPFEREAFGRVASGGDNRARRSQHARPRNDSLIHGLFEFDICVSRAFGAEIADGGEAGHQRISQMIGGARHAQSQPFVRHLIVPRRLVIRVQQNVRMALHHPRH